MKSSPWANLWEIGWFSLLQDEFECESEIGTEKPGGISLIDRDAIQCNCKSVTTSKSALFELVVLPQGCTETTFSTKDKLVFQSQKCVFVLAVQRLPTDNEEAQAVVFGFNYIYDTPALVPIYELVRNVKVDDIDPQQFTRMK